MTLPWINPDRELPSIQSDVLIAIGTTQNKIESYKMAKVGHSGQFQIENGSYGYNCLYSEKSPHRTNNKYRVIAWCHFEECNLDDIVEARFFAIDKDGKEVTKDDYDRMTPVERSFLAYSSESKPIFDYMGVDNE